MQPAPGALHAAGGTRRPACRPAGGWSKLGQPAACPCKHPCCCLLTLLPLLPPRSDRTNPTSPAFALKDSSNPALISVMSIIDSVYLPKGKLAAAAAVGMLCG